ncbi:MAG: type II secretion system protein [Planctomycetes bacterium]|nr:type II secretion system protein [Planctomycetota bacterium]
MFGAQTRTAHMPKPVSRPIRGFTLIELLVVIAIISLLMSILLPSLRKAVGHAEAVQCSTQLKAWGVALTMYMNDYNECMPYAEATKHLSQHLSLSSDGAESARFCPTSYKEVNPKDAYDVRHAVYLSNYWVFAYSGANVFLKQIAAPDRTIGMLDRNRYELSYGAGFTTYPDASQRIGFPHFDNCNSMFVDGHVEAVPISAMSVDYILRE